MSLVVPFDGSSLSLAALARADQFRSLFEEEVIAVTVIPNADTEYARDRDWIGPTERFDAESIVAALRDQVQDVCPVAEFQTEFVSRYAPAGEISSTIRHIARSHDATVVVIGSDNAGRIVSGVGDVGASVATDQAYDVHIVRHQLDTADN